jgi:hypothetical protein
MRSRKESSSTTVQAHTYSGVHEFKVTIITSFLHQHMQWKDRLPDVPGVLQLMMAYCSAYIRIRTHCGHRKQR